MMGPYPPPGGYGAQPPPSTMQPLPPPPPGALRVLVPTMNGSGLNDTVASVFARAPFFTIIDIVNGEPANVTPIPNPYAYTGGGAGAMAAQFIVSSNIHVVLAPSIGPNTMPILQSAGIRYIPVQPGIRVADALKASGLVK
jgi:predicted Fe-Mo cluster-binding NifX family protein